MVGGVTDRRCSRWGVLKFYLESLKKKKLTAAFVGSEGPEPGGAKAGGEGRGSSRCRGRWQPAGAGHSLSRPGMGSQGVPWGLRPAFSSLLSPALGLGESDPHTHTAPGPQPSTAALQGLGEEWTVPLAHRPQVGPASSPCVGCRWSGDPYRRQDPRGSSRAVQSGVPT